MGFWLLFQRLTWKQIAELLHTSIYLKLNSSQRALYSARQKTVRNILYATFLLAAQYIFVTIYCFSLFIFNYLMPNKQP